MTNWLHPSNAHNFTTAMAYWFIGSPTLRHQPSYHQCQPFMPSSFISDNQNETETKLFIKMSNLEARGRKRLEKRIKNKLNNKLNNEKKIPILLNKLEICENIRKWMDEAV